jgi:hypothetical protein
MYAPAGFVNQTQLKEIVDAAIKGLDPAEVVRVNCSIGEDHTGDPAIFFRVVLTDDAARKDRPWEVTERVRSSLPSASWLLENWGLFPYESFRSSSEQCELNDPEWA